MLDLRLTMAENADDRLVLVTPITQTLLLAALAIGTLVGQFFVAGISWVLLIFFLIFAAGALFHERWEFDRADDRVVRLGGIVPFRRETDLAATEVTTVLLELFTIGRSTRETGEADPDTGRGRREGPFGSKRYCRLALLLDEEASTRLGRSLVTVEAIKARSVDDLHATAARIAEVLGVRLEVRQ